MRPTYDGAMAQPQHVPVNYADRGADGERLPPAGEWVATRPAEVVDRGKPSGLGLGNPGPDQGFVLKLLRQFEGRVRTQPGEHLNDVLAGSVGVALKRASLFGRAPVIHDLEAAFSAWGFLDASPPAELVRLRRQLFAGCRGDYSAQRAVADSVRDDVLQESPAKIAAAVADDFTAVFEASSLPSVDHTRV